jgi:hypothetical protein
MQPSLGRQGGTRDAATDVNADALPAEVSRCDHGATCCDTDGIDVTKNAGSQRLSVSTRKTSEKVSRWDYWRIGLFVLETILLTSHGRVSANCMAVLSFVAAEHARQYSAGRGFLPNPLVVEGWYRETIGAPVVSESWRYRHAHGGDS